MSQNPQAIWNNAIASGQFNTDSPVTVPTTPQGVAQIVEIAGKQIWDIVLAESAKAPDAQNCHLDISYSDGPSPITGPRIFRVQAPSPAPSYGAGTVAFRVTALDPATGLAADAIGRLHFRVYRTGPLSG